MAPRDFNRFSIDNISGSEGGWKYFLLVLPGLILQWLLYMAPIKEKAFNRQATRVARSPLFALIASIAFCVFLAYQIAQYFNKI